MKTIPAIVIASAVIWVGTAQAVNISGMVKDNVGNGMGGVNVWLGKADVSATTGTDGSFTLKDNATGVNHQIVRYTFTSASQPAVAPVTRYDVKGRLLVSRSNDRSSCGIHICRVTMNNAHYTFKAIAGMSTDSRTAVVPKANAPVKKASAPFADALLFTKDGYQLSRIALVHPDTSGIQITMVPLVTGTVKDVEGNEYQTVRIGKQEWTAENLRTTKYNDGAAIPQGGGSGAAFWFYGNKTDAAAKKKWGALYNFAAVKTGKLAPAGWHVPTDAEWDTLQNYLVANGYNFDGTTSENKIAKSLSAKTDWQVYNEPGAISCDVSRNNASGFSALPAGYRYYDGVFSQQGEVCFWWTATEYDASYAWYRNLWAINFNMDKSHRVKTLGCSVRLLRNN